MNNRERVLELVKSGGNYDSIDVNEKLNIALTNAHKYLDRFVKDGELKRQMIKKREEKERRATNVFFVPTEEPIEISRSFCNFDNTLVYQEVCNDCLRYGNCLASEVYLK